MWRVFFPALVAVALLPCPGRADDDVFDIKAILAPPLQPRTLKVTEKDGIVTEEVMFHSEMDGGKRVDIFGYFSYPKGGKKLPAFIWNQGGLYRATPYWTEFGAKRGYAALCIDFPIPGYRSTGGYPINSGLELGEDPKKAPIYHGAVALLRAVSYLESRPEVDRGRIGMAGSSWGGFYTTLMAGVDSRLKVGSSMFGCGGLQLGNQWWDGRGKDATRDDTFRRRWRATLDPAARLASVKTPIAWFTGTNDQFYWLPGLMESHRLAAGPKHLALLPNVNHALTPALDEQVFVWLDIHLKDARPFLKVSDIEVVAEKGKLLARWAVSGARPVKGAELALSYGEAGNWQSRYWQVLRAESDGKVCTAELPGGRLPYYVTGTVTDGDGFRSSTPLARVDPGKYGLERQPLRLDYDGCSLWGGFEAGQVKACQLHGWPVPALTGTARQGEQAALLKGGAWASPPVLYTAGLKHRLSCAVRSDGKTQVTLQLHGTFDGRRQTEQRVVTVDKGWSTVSLEMTPPRTLSGSVTAGVVVPAGAAVMLDAVTFRPVTPSRVTR